jgi:hypothetical protein
VVSELPVSDAGGGVLLREILHMLSQWGDIHVVAPVLPHQEDLAESLRLDLSGIVVSWTALEAVRTRGKRLFSLRRMASGLPAGIYNFATPQNERLLAQARNRIQPDRELVISSWALAAYPDQRFSPATHLFMVNVDSEIVTARDNRRLRKLDAVLERKKVAKYCVRGLQSAGRVGAITRKDTDTLALLSGRRDICHLPPVMRPRPVGRDSVEQGAILLPTNFTYPHNQAATLWFLNEVWLRVDRRARLWITGRDDRNGTLQSLCQRFERMEYLGCLPPGNLESRFARAAVCVNPTRSGSGFQIKLLDALARGVPVVTTRFSNPIGPEIPSSDEPREFAELVNQLAFSPRTTFHYSDFYAAAVDAWSHFLSLPCIFCTHA